MLSLWTASGFLFTTEFPPSLLLVTLPVHYNFASLLTLEFVYVGKIGTTKVQEEQLLLLMKDNLSVKSFALMKRLIDSD